jgi:hypothetical protein
MVRDGSENTVEEKQFASSNKNASAMHSWGRASGKDREIDEQDDE